MEMLGVLEILKFSNLAQFPNSHTVIDSHAPVPRFMVPSQPSLDRVVHKADLPRSAVQERTPPLKVKISGGKVRLLRGY
jgi:hypothetical protein